jgi:hypothetical protein
LIACGWPRLACKCSPQRALSPQIGGAPKAPTITKLADGGLAIASGKIKVTHLLIAVNGTIVKGHEDGTLIATDDVPLHASAHRSAPAWQVRRCSRMLSATPS